MKKRAKNQRSSTSFDIAIGIRVRAARIEKMMSQAELGDALGVSFQQVQKYERGVNRISAGRLHQIAALLGQPAAWFSEGSELKSPGGRPASDLGALMLGTSFGRRLIQAFLAIDDVEERMHVVRTAEILAARLQRRLQAAE